jgi:hypothetical protein
MFTQRLQPVALEFSDPALANFVDWHGIEVVQLLTAPPHGGAVARYWFMQLLI